MDFKNKKCYVFQHLRMKQWHVKNFIYLRLQMQLSNRFQGSRRDILRYGSLGIALSCVYFAATNWKVDLKTFIRAYFCCQKIFIFSYGVALLCIGYAICFSKSFVERIGWSKKPFFYTEPRFGPFCKISMMFLIVLTYKIAFWIV